MLSPTLLRLFRLLILGVVVGIHGKNIEGDGSDRTLQKTKYLLYDVKIGEGFNLQKEIFIRAAWLADELNRESTTRTTGIQWTVVLPPWCFLAHWKVSKGTVRDWETFFDVQFLQRATFPVIEYKEYAARMGTKASAAAEGGGGGVTVPAVDLILHLESFRPKEWVPSFQAISCSESQIFQKYFELVNEQDTMAKGVYSGYCNEIRTPRVECLQTWGLGSTFLAKLIGREIIQKEGGASSSSPPPPPISSVFVKNLDHTTGPYDRRYHQYRKLLFPSLRIREVGEAFVSRKLQRPYLAAHVRRTDFATYAHVDTTPNISIVATALEAGRRENNLRSIFVATDATKEEKALLRSHLDSVVFFDDDDGRGAGLNHPGEFAMVEQYLNIISDFFVGTKFSRFTLNIQEDRDLMGVRKDLTWNIFCKEDGNKFCKSSNWFGKDFPPCPIRQELYSRDSAIGYMIKGRDNQGMDNGISGHDEL